MGTANALTGDERQTMIALYKEGETVERIATASGRAVSTVYRVVTGAPAAAQASVDTIHRLLAVKGPFASMEALSEASGFAASTISTLVGVLRDKGWAETRWGRSPYGRPMIDHIGLTHEGHQNVPIPPGTHEPVAGSHISRRPADPTDFRNLPSRAPGGEVVRKVGKVNGGDEPAPKAVYEAAHPNAQGVEHPYPLLEAILGRSKSMTPLKAAVQALEVGDPLRRDLEKRLEQMGLLTPLEREYLRFYRDVETKR